MTMSAKCFAVYAKVGWLFPHAMKMYIIQNSLKSFLLRPFASRNSG
jgi:hypothetical protein